MKTLRNLSFLFVAGLFFAGCHSNDDEVGNWKKVESFGGMGRLGAVSFVLGERAYVGTGISENARELKDFTTALPIVIRILSGTEIRQLSPGGLV